MTRKPDTRHQGRVEVTLDTTRLELGSKLHRTPYCSRTDLLVAFSDNGRVRTERGAPRKNPKPPNPKPRVRVKDKPSLRGSLLDQPPGSGVGQPNSKKVLLEPACRAQPLCALCYAWLTFLDPHRPPPYDRRPSRVSMTAPGGSSSELSRTAWVSRVLGVAFTGAAAATQVGFQERCTSQRRLLVVTAPKEMYLVLY